MKSNSGSRKANDRSDRSANSPSSHSTDTRNTNDRNDRSANSRNGRHRNSRNDRSRFDSCRRTDRKNSRFYDTVNDMLPFRLTFVSSAILIGIVFIVFAITCFAAVTLSSSSEKLDTAKAHVRSCAGYYAAESTAVDILTILAADDGNSLADKNGELKYRPENAPDTMITISRNGGSFSFDVPVQESAGVSQRTETGADTLSGSTGTSADAISVNTGTGAQKNLHVIAQITEGNINVIEWYLRDAD